VSNVPTDKITQRLRRNIVCHRREPGLAITLKTFIRVQRRDPATEKIYPDSNVDSQNGAVLGL
jgi:hypothetical protein